MPCPKVSVLMSVFNGETFLSQAIESILNQTFREFEFVIVNDGSTDRTGQMLDDYARRDSRVRIVTHANRGRAESLNRGLELCGGRYIARMDADDISLPCRLEEQVDYLELHPAVGLLGGSFEIIDTAGNVLEMIRCPLDDAEIRSHMLVSNPMCHPAVVMRKDVAVASGGYRRPLLDADDYDLWLRMAERCVLANLDTAVVRYRIHSGQVSIQNMEHQTWCVLAARAAASVRKNGKIDPLTNVDEINLRVLEALGVAPTEITRAVAGTYDYWIGILRRSDPEAARRLVDRLLRLLASQSNERSALADGWLKAAELHYEQGRPVQAFLSAGRGLLTRPIIMGRPVKRAFKRLAGRHST